MDQENSNMQLPELALEKNTLKTHTCFHHSHKPWKATVQLTPAAKLILIPKSVTSTLQPTDITS